MRSWCDHRSGSSKIYQTQGHRFFWGADPCEIQHSRLFLGIYFYTWLVSNTTKPRKFPNHHRKLVRNRFRHKSLNVPRLHPRPLDSIIEDRTKSHKSTEQHKNIKGRAQLRSILPFISIKFPQASTSSHWYGRRHSIIANRAEWYVRANQSNNINRPDLCYNTVWAQLISGLSFLDGRWLL